MSAEQQVVERARRAFQSGRSRPLEYRLQQLKRLQCFIRERQTDITTALKQDLNKSEQASLLYEVLSLEGEISLAVDRLAEWAAPRPVEKSLLTLSDQVFIQPQPLGVVLIIGAWNYPWVLILQPLIGAISAGNAVILKPSEVSCHSAKVMQELLPLYLDQTCIAPDYILCEPSVRDRVVEEIRKSLQEFYTDDPKSFPDYGRIINVCHFKRVLGLMEGCNLIKRIITETSSGGVLANDCIMHFTISALPFGGVGNSGMGRYHGKHTFDQLSHLRACMVRGLAQEALNSMRYPPHTLEKLRWARLLILSRVNLKQLRRLAMLAVLTVIGAFVAQVRPPGQLIAFERREERMRDVLGWFG
ncbi:hypothetical protein JZ751_021308 [Albula glossodonta]|uniref:Aldehyde dehydrogenase family 3 member A2 n=1 Tax=Albula glossodonta TaxID=121402 RepID=A0A8T2NJS2_9TELE|nr:hypothetical protein JZ751_021308 [Albula glossodonta]